MLSLLLISLPAARAEDFRATVPSLNSSFAATTTTQATSVWSSRNGVDLHAQFSAASIVPAPLKFQTSITETVQAMAVSFNQGLHTPLHSSTTIHDSLLRGGTSMSPIADSVLQQLNTPVPTHTSLLPGAVLPNQIPSFAPTSAFHGMR